MQKALKDCKSIQICLSSVVTEALYLMESFMWLLSLETILLTDTPDDL